MFRLSGRVFFLSTFLTSGFILSQEILSTENKKMDSIKMKFFTEAAVRNPVLRQVVISAEFLTKQNAEGELYDNKIYDGKLSHQKMSVLVTLPLKTWKKNSITSSLNFIHQQYHLSEVVPVDPRYEPHLQDLKLDRASLGFNFGYQRTDSLFKKRVIYSANINGLTSDASRIQRVGFLGTVLLQLRANKNTNYSVGMVVRLNRSVNIPVLPVVLYWHRFENNFELNVQLPQQIAVRKSFNNKLTGALEVNLSPNVAFLTADNQNYIPNEFSYNTLALKSGFVLEYRITDKMIFGINTGYQKSFNGRGFNMDTSVNNYFLRNKLGGSPYVMATVSLLPVFKSLF